MELFGVYEIKSMRVKSHCFGFINQRRLSFGQDVRYLLQMEAKSNIFQQKLNHEGFVIFEIKCGCALSKERKKI